MEKSDSIVNIGNALLKFDSEVSKISKTETNPYFKNKYAPLPQILDEIKEPLQVAGLTVKQFPDGEHGLTTLIIHPESGEFISCTYTMRPAKDDPQGEGSRITYQRRYALGAVLGLSIDIDDDGNKSSDTSKSNDERQWLGQKAYEQIIKRIQTNDPGEFDDIQKFVDQIIKTYRMKTEYKQAIFEELNSDFNQKMNK